MVRIAVIVGDFKRIPNLAPMVNGIHFDGGLNAAEIAGHAGNPGANLCIEKIGNRERSKNSDNFYDNQ